MCYACTAHALRVSYACATHVLHMCCACATCVLRVCCTCAARVLRVYYTCVLRVCYVCRTIVCSAQTTFTISPRPRCMLELLTKWQHPFSVVDCVRWGIIRFALLLVQCFCICIIYIYMQGLSSMYTYIIVARLIFLHMHYVHTVYMQGLRSMYTYIIVARLMFLHIHAGAQQGSSRVLAQGVLTGLGIAWHGVLT